jgi:general secretion pathway protein G
MIKTHCPNAMPGRYCAARADRAHRRGLTLIEVLIVIAILLAIAGLVIVNLLPQKEHADIDLQKVQLATIEDALQTFKLNMKRYPTEDEGLAGLWDKSVISNEDEAANWRGPYLEKPIIKDTWGSALVYKSPGENNPAGYDLTSFGPDKQEGTADDITNGIAAGNSDDSTGSADTGESTPPADTGDADASGGGGG